MKLLSSLFFALLLTILSQQVQDATGEMTPERAEGQNPSDFMPNWMKEIMPKIKELVQLSKLKKQQNPSEPLSDTSAPPEISDPKY